MVRRPYRTKCRFLRDSDIESTVHWYIVPPSNGTLGFPCRINSSDWRDNRFSRSPVGEVNFADRPFDGWNRIVPPVPGDHLCGSEDDFRNGGTYRPDLPPFERGEDGLPLCCRPKLGGAALGGVSMVAEPWFRTPAPAAAGGDLVPLTLFPEVDPALAPLLVPGEWYQYNAAALGARWFKWDSNEGDVWAFEFVWLNTPPTMLAGYPVVRWSATVPGNTLPFTVDTVNYKEVEHTPTFFPVTRLYYGVHLDLPANNYAFRFWKLN